jgi:hypothetical protein
VIHHSSWYSPLLLIYLPSSIWHALISIMPHDCGPVIAVGIMVVVAVVVSPLVSTPVFVPLLCTPVIGKIADHIWYFICLIRFILGKT